MKKIILIGNGGHAKSVADTIEAMGEYEIAGFVAKEPDDTFEYRGYKIIGVDTDLEVLFQQGIRYACVCVGFLGKGTTRDELYRNLKSIGYELPVIIDKTAAVANDAVIGEGTFVGKRAVINAASAIGKMCIVNTAAVVEHDCIIKDFTHISVNATVCGGVSIGDHCLIGAGATAIQEVSVGDNVIVGANSTVLANVSSAGTVYGVYKG